MRDIAWVDAAEWRPGDRFKYQPIGGHIHWHDVVRVELRDGVEGDDLPRLWDRCLAAVSCR